MEDEVCGWSDIPAFITQNKCICLFCESRGALTSV